MQLVKKIEKFIYLLNSSLFCLGDWRPVDHPYIYLQLRSQQHHCSPGSNNGSKCYFLFLVSFYSFKTIFRFSGTGTLARMLQAKRRSKLNSSYSKVGLVQICGGKSVKLPKLYITLNCKVWNADMAHFLSFLPPCTIGINTYLDKLKIQFVILSATLMHFIRN